MCQQSFPRGDWSGNPETFYRPHSHVGGDLPPWHAWSRLPFAERAARWARGERPDGVVDGSRFQVGGSGTVTFYDPSLAKFGNAVSPFQMLPSYEAAHLAELRRPEDRYDPRYFAQAPGTFEGAVATGDPVQAYEYLASLFADHPEIAGSIMITCAGARSADGSFVDTRPPGRGLLMDGESQPMPNAVGFGVETREEANRLRAFIGDEVMGVPIVYSVRQEWMKQMPHLG